MMTDPKFFQEQIAMTKEAKTHDDIVRLRLYMLQHYGIESGTLSDQDAQEAQENFIKASEIVDSSPWHDLGAVTDEDFEEFINQSKETTENKEDE